jgi:hypothetical protein
METSELIFGGALVAVLLGVAGFYGWRQVRTLRGLRGLDMRPPEECRFLRGQAWRRLVGSGLMAIFAGLLVGTLAFNPSLRRLADRDEEARRNNEERVLSSEDRDLAHAYGVYWIICLCVLLAILGTATLDLVATRRYGRRQIMQIQSDRRRMIEREIARSRKDRNGHV